jgi:hypothetical protein
VEVNSACERLSCNARDKHTSARPNMTEGADIPRLRRFARAAGSRKWNWPLLTPLRKVLPSNLLPRHMRWVWGIALDALQAMHVLHYYACMTLCTRRDERVSEHRWIVSPAADHR